jgi:hypothetical protein
VLLLTAVTVTVIRRVRRARVVPPDGPEEWWAELRERLRPHGVTWSDAMTPRQASDVIRDEYRSRSEVDDDTVAALDRLARAVESERYSPSPVLPAAEDLAAWTAAVERPFVQPTGAELVGAAPRE